MSKMVWAHSTSIVGGIHENMGSDVESRLKEKDRGTKTNCWYEFGKNNLSYQRTKFYHSTNCNVEEKSMYLNRLFWSNTWLMTWGYGQIGGNW